MAAPVCELCGSTDFVKDDGMFVCQGCGTKYSTEEARKLMRVNATAASATANESAQPQAPCAQQSLPEGPASVSEFDLGNLQNAELGVRFVNNYVCKGFQLLIDEYDGIDHPSKDRHDALVANARQCLELLEAAAQADISNHEVCLLVYKNCAEIEDAVQQTDYWEQDEEGAWHSHSGFFLKLEPTGQKDSWDDKMRYHRDFLEQQYVDTHTLEWQQRLELMNKADALKADIADLKDEKRSKGFFNFAEKREVKDRMRPVKDELKEVQRQIGAIDRNVDTFIEEKLSVLGQTYTRLDY